MTRVAGYYPVKATIAEMGANTDELVQLDPELVKAVVGDDPDPMFVTIEVLNESISTNGRFYDRDTIIDIAQQINDKHPDGYKGHLTDAERDHKVPDAETIWLGARVIDDQGKARLIAKGYVLPEARTRRSVLKRAKSIGRNVAVSIYGTARRTYDSVKKAYRLAEYNLESIDWTRPGSEGVKNSGIFAITAEMHSDGKSSKPKKEESMTIQEALNAATADDIRAHAKAEVVAEITSEAIEAVKAEHREVVSEMTKQNEEQLGTVAEMQAKLNGYELSDQLKEKVSDKSARKMVERMVISEMKADSELDVTAAVSKVLESEDGKAIIAEMTVVEPKITPALINTPVASTRKYISKKGN